MPTRSGGHPRTTTPCVFIAASFPSTSISTEEITVTTTLYLDFDVTPPWRAVRTA